MKSIYCIFSAILALLLCFSFAACSGSGSPNEKEPEKHEKSSEQADPASSDKTDSSASDKTDASASDKAEDGKEAAVGTVLDKPEKVLELEEFYVALNLADNESETGIKTMELTLSDKGNTAILYVSDGMLKLNEIVYELSNGNISKYTKNVFDENFSKDEQSSKSEVEKEILTLNTFLEMLGYGFTESTDFANVQFKKCEDVKITLTGEAYKYELYENGKSNGMTILVDKQTGIFVKMTNPDGSDVMTVTAIKTDDVNIPAYK